VVVDEALDVGDDVRRPVANASATADVGTSRTGVGRALIAPHLPDAGSCRRDEGRTVADIDRNSETAGDTTPSRARPNAGSMAFATRR
jgi:hypothetical protein